VRSLLKAELEIGLGLTPGQAAAEVDCRLPARRLPTLLVKAGRRGRPLRRGHDAR
jgi:hypothetical protein